LLVGRRTSRAAEVRRVLPAENLERERPRARFVLDPGAIVRAEREARGEGLELVGAWHSHPDAEPLPSRADREGAWPGWSIVIVGGRPRDDPALKSWRLRAGELVEEAVVVVPRFGAGGG